MSDIVMMSQNDGCLNVYVDNASIMITELRLVPNTNLAKPFRIYGCGDASIALTNEQVLQIIAEYLRYTLPEPVAWTQVQVGFKFDVEFESKE